MKWSAKDTKINKNSMMNFLKNFGTLLWTGALLLVGLPFKIVIDWLDDHTWIRDIITFIAFLLILPLMLIIILATFVIYLIAGAKRSVILWA